MPAKASPELSKRIIDTMRVIIKSRAAVAAILAVTASAAVGIAYSTGAFTPKIAGAWRFQTTGSGTCGVPYDGWTIPVWQEGNTFYGN